MKTLYTARATTVAGREGHSQTDDKQLSVKLSKPGSGKEGTTNPEQLFAAGYSACFGSAVEAVAKKQQTPISEVKIEAAVNLNQDDENGYFLSVTLNAILAGVDDETAEQLVEKAHHVCPYSKATRGNIEVTLQANGKDLAQNKRAA
jgi:osmotically inducible protein OsmC